MRSRQRVGLWLTLAALITSIIFTGEPGLTEEAWGMINIFSIIMCGIGGVLFISD